MEIEQCKYRVLWTWDYCTRWDDSFFWQGRGCTGANARRGLFLDDYIRMVDYAELHGINGIVIWGALRKHDNGEEQLKKLASYGKKKGVRIIPGCGIFSYGGVYYDPRLNYNGYRDNPMERNPYSLYTWLSDHPELAAVDPEGKPYKQGPYSVTACPSRRENVEWFKNSIKWLLTEFDVGGVQVEVGDYSVCHCDACKKRRENNINPIFCIEDMIDPYTEAINAIIEIKPDAWVICETYSSFAKPNKPEQPAFGSALDEFQQKALTALPKGAIFQWVLDRATGLDPSQTWLTGYCPPTSNNIGRIHAGSQWGINSTEEWAIYSVGDLVAKARTSNLGGVSIFGEESPASPPNEANYLIFSEFNGFGNPNPDFDYDLFFSQTLDPLYGGKGLAREWERIYITGHIIRLARKPFDEDDPNFRRVHLALNKPELLNEARKMHSSERAKCTAVLAQEAHAISSKLSGEACRRWSWLENWLWRAEYLHMTDNEIINSDI